MTWFRSGSRGAAAICLLLAVIHTWPLVTDPGTLSRNDNADAELNEWAMAWIAHQLPRDPAHLFDANIFYPERLTLAYSEPLIVPALIGAPLAWAGASPVFVFNVVLILGFALTAYAAYRLVHEWTGDHAAGLVAGSLFAFNSHMLSRLAHIQGIHAWGLPLALLSADRIMVHRRGRDAVWLAVWMAAMAATSGYLVVFGAVMIAVVVVTRVPDWIGHARRVLVLFAIATGLAAIAILPIYLPYRRLALTMGMIRTIDSVTMFSATLKSYVASIGRLHYSLWSHRITDSVDPFFPGVAVIVLALLALTWAFVGRPAMPAWFVAALTRRRLAMLVAIAITGFVLSLGNRTPVYGWVYTVFPPMHGLRAAARFGNLFLLAMGAMAGFGLAALRARLTPRHGAWVAVALVALVNLESLRAPLGFTRFEGVPAIYSFLAAEPGQVRLVDVPFYPPEGAFENAEYMLYSTAHWRPTFNGYSGYFPVSYRENSKAFWFFPKPHAVDAMRRAGVTHVMVHPKGFGSEAEEMWKEVAANPHLERIAITPGGPALYRLK